MVADRHPSLLPLLDPAVLFATAAALQVTFIIMCKQAANRADRSARAQTNTQPPPSSSASASASSASVVAPPSESSSPLLRMAQHQLMAMAFIYAHVFHWNQIDDAVAHPLGLFLAALTVTHLLLTRWLGARGLWPDGGVGQRLLRTWRRWFFLLPEDPAVIVWTATGYVLARWAFPATTGSGGAGWSWDALQPGQAASTTAAAAQEERAGGELCAYSWRSDTSGAMESGAALRSCPDLSLLCLIYAGILWPLVEFARLLIVRCSKLHAKQHDHAAPTAVQGAGPGSKTSAANAHSHAADHSDDCDDCDSADDGAHGSAFDSDSVSLLARVVACSWMAAACMLVTWLLSIAALVWAHEAAMVRPADESACPAPVGSGGSGAFEREAALLQPRGSNDCALQWSHVQNALMLQYGSCGLLAALFGFAWSPLPSALRLQLLVPLCVALWKGSVMPACIVVATRCIG